MLRGESDAVAGSAVRVWSRAGEVVGAGFVAGPDTVATCAHVVAEALGADAYAASPPRGVVALDLPLLGGRGAAPRVTGTVSRWLPIGPDGTGDVALLRVREPLPIGARMPPLRRADDVWNRSFRALGFPDGAWDGVWSSGRLRAGQGTGWVQLQTVPGDQPVVGGFSGSPVWLSAAGAVIGMTVAADRGGTTTAYVVPIDRVLGLDPELLPCPYQGLAPFTEEQAAYFFGRDDDIARLVAAIGREPIVALAGPSGAGKSSLLRAGLVPRLRRAGAQMVEMLPGASVADFVPDGTDQVLVLDQFEELAARDPQLARAQLDAIVALTRTGPVRAVLTLRGSALDDLLTPGLAKVLNAATLHVAPLDRANLRETIVKPAERAPGLDFEPGLVDRILDDAGSEPGQLPLVESLLADLWRRREGGRLTWRGYTEAGGVVGSVAQHAERVVARLAGPRPDVGFYDRLRRLFGLLAAPDAGGRIVRVPVPTAALAPDLRTLVPQLAAGRLLVLGRDTHGDEIVELAHQALIAHWPRLRNWLEQDRVFLAWRAQADQQRDRWEASGRDDGSLLRGSALDAAGEWIPARASEVSPQTREFVARSTARQRRDVRRSRLVIALLSALAVAAGLLVVISEQRGSRLAERLAAANADSIGRESGQRLEVDPLMAAQLALAAYRADPSSPGARSALGSAYLALKDADVMLPDLGGNVGVTMLEDDTALVATSRTMALVTGVGGPTPQRWQIPDHGPDDGLVARGDWLAVTTDAGEVRLWDVPSRTLRRTVTVDGRIRAATDWDGNRLGLLVERAGAMELQLLDVGSGASTARSLPGVAPNTDGLSLLADGTVLLRSGTGKGDDPERRVVRTLAADPAGDAVTPLPDGTETVRDKGAFLLRCVPPTPGAAGAKAAVDVVPVAGEVTARRVPLSWNTCAEARPTFDGRWLVENAGVVDERSQDVLRITDLTDGSQYQALVPRVPLASRRLPGGELQAEVRLAVTRGADGIVRVLALEGPTLDPEAPNAALLRVTAAPAAPESDSLAPSTDGRWAVATQLGKGITAFDRRTGAVAGFLPLVLGPDDSSVEVDDGVWVQQATPAGFRLRRFDLPTLREQATYDIPPTGAGGGYADTAQADRGADPGSPIAVVANGTLSAVDRTTGRRLGGPVPVTTTDAGRRQLATDPTAWPRPRHPGQVLINGPDGVELWDAVAGRRIGTIPMAAAGKAGLAVARDGRLAAVLGSKQTIEVYDLDTFQQVRPPVAMTGVWPTTFTDDGLLVLTTVGADRIVFVDLDTGREAGSLVPGFFVSPYATSPTGRTMTVGEESMRGLSDVSLRAQDWFDHVCGLMNRPFTAAELAVLPEGTDTAPPCGG